ncbi:DUF4190 domain-containing protein [Kitasatospora sp. NRRL B-11411]|uniref:DUF4190 domain-containing protein n=1 Tax=Kitasatospora sp. NRRL B-11411 TaxID=1463822 RepID=UPI000D146ED8|nr:DUF4190 domain-containing protein [Kitasatospora sp. NRRL B-11411]
MSQAKPRVVSWGAGRVEDDGPPMGTNRLALWSAISGVFGLVPFALGFGVFGLMQTRRSGQPGRGLAVLGLVTSVLWTGVLVNVVAAPGVGVDRDSTGRVSTAQYSSVFDMRSGDCFTWAPLAADGSVEMVRLVPCAQGHDAQVYGAPSLAMMADSLIEAAAEDACADARAGRELPAGVRLGLIYPDRTSFAKYDRRVVCYTSS